jgi:hypothetical protein
MHTKTFIASVIAASMATYASAAPFPSSRSSLPLLSGTYTFTEHQFCQPVLDVTYSKILPAHSQKTVSAATNTTLTNTDGFQVQFGTIKLTQSGTPGQGALALAGVSMSGTSLLVSNNGDGQSGNYGNPTTTSAASTNGTFSQTATQVSLSKSGGGTITFSIFYGKVTGGVVQNAVFGGFASGCTNDFSITRN